MSGLIWIQTALHSDGISKRFFFLKKLILETRGPRGLNGSPESEYTFTVLR